MKIAKLFVLQGNTQKRQSLNATHFYFISKQPQCCFTFSLTELQMLQYLMLLNTYNHHCTETRFIINSFVPMSKPMFIYVIYFHFQPNFCCH